MDSREHQRKALDLLEVFMGEDWQESLPKQLKTMFSHCFGRLWNVQTPNDAVHAARAILERVPKNEVTMIERYIRQMSRDGQNVVVLGNFDAPEGHAYFHLVGARMQNVGSVFLFSLPLDRFLQMRAAATQQEVHSESKLTENRLDFSRLMRDQLPPANHEQ